MENEFIYCKNCGAQLDKEAFFCNSCGTFTQNAANLENPVQPEQPQQPSVDPNITKKEYYNKYAPASIKKAIRNAAIWCYVCGGLTVLSAVLMNPLGIIDGLVFIGLGLGVHLGQSKACAIIALVLACLEVVLALALTGMLSGWLWIVAGICCIIAVNKLDKSYKQFKQGLVSNTEQQNFQ